MNNYWLNKKKENERLKGLVINSEGSFDLRQVSSAGGRYKAYERLRGNTVSVYHPMYTDTAGPKETIPIIDLSTSTNLW